MFKKALSLLLALMLVVASFSVAVITVAAADGDAGSGSDLKVTATSNFFPTKEQSFTQEEINANNGKVTVTYFIQSEDRLVNADWTLTYDGTVLALNEEANQHMMPIATDAQVNFTPTSVQPGVKGNCTSLNTYFLCDENGDRTAFVTATFDVIGSGDTTVNLTVNEMRTTQLEDGKSTSDVENEKQIVSDGAVVESFACTPTTAVYAGEYDDDYVDPQPTEAPTEAPTETPTEAPSETPTEEPTEAPADDVCIVAGSEPEIFGTGWDGTNEANLMTKQADGTYTKDYTVDKAFDAVQLKTVKNGAEWIGDPTGNNVPRNLYCSV